MSRRARAALARMALVVLAVLSLGSGLGNPGCDDGDDYVEPRAASFEEYACRVAGSWGDRQETQVSGDPDAPTRFEPSNARRWTVFGDDPPWEGDFELLSTRAGELAIIVVDDAVDQPFVLARDGVALEASGSTTHPSCEGATIHLFQVQEGLYDLHIGPVEDYGADFLIQYPDAY